MKAKIEHSLHFISERCDRLEGFMIFHSLLEDAGCELGLAFHEVVSKFYGNKFCINFPIFETNSPSDHDHQILNQVLSTIYLQKHSNMVIPIELGSLNYKIVSDLDESNNIQDIGYELISEIAFMLTMPLRRRFLQSMNISSLINKLMDNDSLKFISSNMYPLVNQDKRNIDDSMVAQQTLINPSFGSGNFNNNASYKNLIIYEGLLSPNTRDNIHKFLRVMNNDTLNSKNGFHTTSIIYFNPFTIPLMKGIETQISNRMLFCGNSTAILTLFRQLLSRFNMKSPCHNLEFLKCDNRNEMISRRHYFNKITEDIIQSYEGMIAKTN